MEEMRRLSPVVLVFLAATSTTVFSQEKPFSLAVQGSFTTGSQLFTNPDSPNPIEQSEFVPLEDLFGVGLEVKYSLPESHFVVGLSADYIQTTQTSLNSSLVPVEDGYHVVPVEITAYFIIPVSGPVVDVFMGGGGGTYFGRRVYRLAGVEAATADPGVGFGIHVLGGVTVRIYELFALTGEMKFRDVQFETTNAFSVSHIVHNGRVIDVSTEPFSSSVHTDGVVFQLGLAVNVF